jgi:hypothetical protein
MAIDIPSNFNLGARLPLDARYIVNTYSELTGSSIKYSGMQGYVVQDKKIYYLENLDTNNWVEVGAGAGNSVYTTGNQSIGGIKNFNGTLQYDGNMVATITDLNDYLSNSNASTTYATIINLQNTGSTLYTKIDNLSGYVVGITGTFGANVNALNTNAVLKTGNQGISGIKTFEKVSLDSTLTLNNTGTFLKDRYDSIAEIGDYGGGLFYNFEKGFIDVYPDIINGLIPSLKGNFDIITGYGRNAGSATINKLGNVMITYGYTHSPTDTTSDKTFVRIYTKSNDKNSFELKQTITGDYFTDLRGFGRAAYGPYFGAHVSTSASGNILAISELFSPSPYNNLLSSGAVYIYTGNTGNGWSLKQKIFTPISGKDLSSMEMSENGDVFIVSNRNYYGDYFGQGIAYVYTGNTSDSWSLKQTLNNFNNQLMSGYYFGTSISIANSGKVFAIGVPNADNNSVDINGGAVVLYTGNKTDGWNIAQRILGTGIDRFLGQVVKLNTDGDILATNWTSGWGVNNRTVNGNINIYTGDQNKNYNLKQILDGYYLGSENNSTYYPSFGGKFEFANSGNTLITNHNAKIFKYNYLGNLEGIDWNIVSIFTGTKNNPYKFRDYISSYGNKYSYGDTQLNVQGVSENAKTLVVSNNFGANPDDSAQLYIFNQTAYNNINFSRPPSVNGVQMLTKGDMPLKQQIVDTISSQSISGNKNFVVQPTYNGEKLAVLSGTKIPSSYIPSNINFNIKQIFLTTSGLSDKNKDYFSLENLYDELSEFDLNLISSFPYFPYNKYIINVGAYNNTGNTIALRFDPTPPTGSQIIIKNYCPQNNLSLGLTGVSGIRVIIPKYTGEANQIDNDNLINIPYGDFINLTTTGQEFSIIRGIDNNGIASFYKDNWPNYEITQAGETLFNGNRAIKRDGQFKGINPGGTTISEFLNNLFYPFVSASMSLSITPNDLREKGTNITSITFGGSINTGDESIGNITNLLYKITGNTVNTVAAPTTNNLSYTATPPIPITGNAIISVEATAANNGTPIPISSSQNIYFEAPYYWGAGAANLTVDSIKNLIKVLTSQPSSITQSFTSNNNYFYLAYPSNWGPLASIKDSSNLSLLSDFIPSTNNTFTLINGSIYPYYIYVFNKTSTITSYPITFTF